MLTNMQLKKNMIQNLYKNEQPDKKWAWRIIKNVNEPNTIYDTI